MMYRPSQKMSNMSARLRSSSVIYFPAYQDPPPAPLPRIAPTSIYEKKKTPDEERIDKLMQGADNLMIKIRSGNAPTFNNQMSAQSSEFLQSDLSLKFSNDYGYASVMIEFCRDFASISSRQAHNVCLNISTLPECLNILLVLTTTVLLQNILLLPTAEAEITKRAITACHDWFVNQKVSIESITSSESRLWIIRNHRQRKQKQTDLVSNVSNNHDDAIDAFLYRPGIGNSPAKLRTKLRNKLDLADMAMAMVTSEYDLDMDMSTSTNVGESRRDGVTLQSKPRNLEDSTEMFIKDASLPREETDHDLNLNLDSRTNRNVDPNVDPRSLSSPNNPSTVFPTFDPLIFSSPEHVKALLFQESVESQITRISNQLLTSTTTNRVKPKTDNADCLSTSSIVASREIPVVGLLSNRLDASAIELNDPFALQLSADAARQQPLTPRAAQSLASVNLAYLLRRSKEMLPGRKLKKADLKDIGTFLITKEEPFKTKEECMHKIMSEFNPTWQSGGNSQIRAAQTLEVDAIRKRFEKCNLTFPRDVVERGIFSPQNKPVAAILANLRWGGGPGLMGNTNNIRIGSVIGERGKGGTKKKKVGGKKKKMKKTKTKKR